MQKELVELFKDPVIVSMFGKFYEEILAPYLIEFEGYTPLKGMEGKPVAWFDTSKLKNIRSFVDDILIPEAELKEFRRTIDDIEKRINDSKHKRAKCIPDGIVEKNTKYYLWEAKCEPRSILSKAAWWKMKSRIKDFDWFFADSVRVKISGHTQTKAISGYILFWWDRPEEIEVQIPALATSDTVVVHPEFGEVTVGELAEKLKTEEREEHENTVKKLKLIAEKRNKSFEVKYIREILDKLIEEKPKWYIDTINKQKDKINTFFNLSKATV